MRNEEKRLPLPMVVDSERWVSMVAERTVLGIVHNITSATRLLDLLAAFEGDRRVQTVFTCTESSALDGGTLEFFASQGFLHIPWSEAKARKFDVAIATSRGGDLRNLRTPLIGAPHGAGYNKHLKPEAGSRKPEAGSRKPEAGSRKPEAGSRKPEAGSRKPEAGSLRVVAGLADAQRTGNPVSHRALPRGTAGSACGELSRSCSRQRGGG
ncbi:hypothetical protein [Streptomyces sp. NBC_00872]|uniref:hypothetical protein n=1 Tax=Streptomyces sp. NBC_00872 TaxID=2903686 RepID=UPI00386B6B41|nr:hypothetical protein OG214_22290 [Streptomyces sp. NBC_00872]